MRDMRDLSFTMGTWNLELKRLKGGPLVQAILDHFKGFITGERRYKFVMFSGHDTTVATLLNTLGINSKIWVSCQIDFAKLSLFLHISCAFNQKTTYLKLLKNYRHRYPKNSKILLQR